MSHTLLNSVIYGNEMAYTKLLNCVSSPTEMYNVYGACQPWETFLLGKWTGLQAS